MNQSAINIIILLFIVVFIILSVFFKKNSKKTTFQAAHKQSPLSPEEQSLYEMGLHPGEDGIALMYTLKVCRHCVHLKKWLEQHEIPFHEVYVDKYHGENRSELLNKLRSYNPRGSFPTLVLPGGKKALVGFRESELKKTFEKSE